MKRILASVGVLAAAALLMVASSDRIVIKDITGKMRSIWIDDLKSLTFGHSGDDTSSFDQIVVEGLEEDFIVELGQDNQLEYRHGLEEPRITMTVEPHHRCFSGFVDCPEGTYYGMGAIRQEILDQIPRREWDDYIYDVENAKMHEVSDYYDRPLSSYTDDEVFRSGGGQEDWYPQGDNEDLEFPGTPYVAYIYEGHIGPDGLEFVREPYYVPFTAKTLEVFDIDFTVDADPRSNRVTVKADAPEGYDGTYSIELYRSAAVDGMGMDACVKNSLQNLFMTVYYGDKTWDEVLFRGHGEKEFRNLVPGETYYAVAFGCEYGELTAAPVSHTFPVPAPVVTDDCTFTVNATQATNTEMSVEVIPSNPDTRWVALIKATDEFSDEYTPADHAAHMLYFKTNTGVINWNDSEFVHTGASTLDTFSDFIDGVRMEVGRDYTLMFFGVDAEGERSTDIGLATVHTESEEQSVTFDVKFGEYISTSGTDRLPVVVTPSDPDAKYVFEYVTDDGVWIELEDEELMGDFVRMEGARLNLRQGVYEREMMFYSMGYNYLIFLFGYDGQPTSDLYMWRVDTATGQVTQLRGPGTSTE